jgi:hypothetical protein
MTTKTEERTEAEKQAPARKLSVRRLDKIETTGLSGGSSSD